MKIEHADAVASRILKLIPGSSYPLEGTSYNVKGFATLFARLCKNIKETSFNEFDRSTRCQQLANDTGVDVLTILTLTK